ncbi:MAG: hypothetical protein A3H51_00400 [Candidatus Spechtbacteria bacterium RIFCSPLOWO2_02_FULL_38_8]|uniref:Serine-tRNA synthetase type1 N-terminal domain-containing protein n=1 Tax=Candidatus Spechtbacteria bacterium RIFCSPLOWO2_02_FULL_38_8 TaxID=1802164 RepID=A0A1G2HKT0_9BACT|nr:MAG: hypothetical protein A3H51_00400 [Candidatus Spechtbacteria bacterium RIFCSPLOWO2_02_FULL_38_8]
MLDINFIKENAKKVQTGAHNKGFDIDINKVLTLDKQYRELLGEVENLRAKKNEISGEISKLDNQNRTKKKEEAENFALDGIEFYIDEHF